jgi:hypothetical protein
VFEKMHLKYRVSGAERGTLIASSFCGITSNQVLAMKISRIMMIKKLGYLSKCAEMQIHLLV